MTPTINTGVFNKIGGGSAIQVNLIALALHYLCKTPLLVRPYEYFKRSK